MKSRQKHMDFDLGQKVCSELRSGDRGSIIELYNRYARFFAAFARRRLFTDDPHGVESLLSKFWLELLNGKAICKYRGRASLRTYLTIILNRRIIDANRQFERNRKSVPLTKEDEIDHHNHDQQTPETKLIVKEHQKLIQMALVQLSDQSPRDASLIRMNLEGLSYEQMARRELTGAGADADALKRKIEAIKKQFTRKKSGSMAKFAGVIKRNLDSNGMDFMDLFN